jgi:hypothetical protein
MSWFKSLMRKLASFQRLSCLDKLIVVQAAALLPGVWVALGTLGLQRSAALLRWISPRRSEPEDASVAEALRIAKLIGMAARNTPAPNNCLRRSLVLWFLLRQRGIVAELMIGARKSDGEFQAHAWVQLAGTVLNDTQDVAARFPPFPDLSRVISPS